MKQNRYCASHPPPQSIVVSWNVVRVRFISDTSVTAYGFNATYYTFDVHELGKDPFATFIPFEARGVW